MARKSSNGIERQALGIEPNIMVVVVLHSPREKCWGRLNQVNAAGIFLRGIDLSSYEDWIMALGKEEPFIGPAYIFFPMWRVERMIKDERIGDVPSISEQFESRTGRSLTDFF
jgi:hypothetical protein